MARLTTSIWHPLEGSDISEGLFWILDRLRLSEGTFSQNLTLGRQNLFRQNFTLRVMNGWNLKITPIDKGKNHLPEKNISGSGRRSSSRVYMVNPHQSEEITMDLRKDNYQADLTLIYGFTINPL